MLHVNRLGEEVLRAELHGAHRRGHVALPRQEDHRGVALPHVLQHFHAVHAGEPEVEDDHFGAEPVEGRHAGLTAQLPGDLVPQPLEVVPDTAQNVDIIIDEQNGTCHGGHLWWD